MLVLSVFGYVLNSELMLGETAAAFHEPAALIWICHAAMTTLLLFGEKGGPSPAQAGGGVISAAAPRVLELAIEYMACNWLFVVALPLIGVGVTNAIFQGGIVFVYALSVVLLGEPLAWSKSGAVAITCVGLLLLVPPAPSARPSALLAPEAGVDGAGALPQANGTTRWGSRLTGWVVAVNASFISALFKVRFKQLLHLLTHRADVDDDAAAAGTFWLLGLIGKSTLIYLWPLLILLHATGVERIGNPSQANPRTAAVLVLTAMLAVGVNVLSTWAMGLTSPLFMSLAFAMSIPAASLTDALLQGVQVPPRAVAGGVLVLLSTAMMAVFGAAERKTAGRKAAGARLGEQGTRVVGARASVYLV